MFSVEQLQRRGWPADKIDIINSHPIMVDDYCTFNNNIYNILAPQYPYCDTYKWLLKHVDSPISYYKSEHLIYSSALFDKVMQDLDLLLCAYTKIIKQYKLEEIRSSAKEFE